MGFDGEHYCTAQPQEVHGLSSRLTLALAALPVEQREAVVLFEVDGYSLEEVAQMQRASVTAVKSRLFRGRERLRRHYESQEPRAGAVLPASRPAAVPPLERSKEVRHGHG